MNIKSEFEEKFVPNENIKCEKKCFDIVDKWCNRILTKSETGDNWNKIIKREICLMKIKYPFLSEKQIRGKALQKFRIPNSMGDIVRCGVNRVKGNLARELNHLNVKKEPRVPPPFKMMKRNENVEKVKKEIKHNSPSSTELLTEVVKNSAIDEDPIDENSNLTPKKKKLSNPRKCLLKKFRLPHESDTDDDIHEQPSKKIKIEKIDLHEIQENSKYYISQDKSMSQGILEESTINNGDNSNNNSQREENLQMKRMIYSQFSESGKKYLTSFSDWRQTQEHDESQISFNYQNNAECVPNEFDYSIKSPIITKESTNVGNYSHPQKAQRNNKLLMKNPVYSGNKKVEKSFFTISKKSINNSKDFLINRVLKEIQKSSDVNIKAAINKNINFSNFGKNNINLPHLSRLNESFIGENRYFDKENECPRSKREFFNENFNYKPLFEVYNDKNRRILGEINSPLMTMYSDLSEIDSNASTPIISQNNDKSSPNGERAQTFDRIQFSLSNNSSEKAFYEISQHSNSIEILNEDELTQIITQPAISLSPLPTDNSQDNPWLNLTSQDFSQMDHNYSQPFTQDSGKVTQDTITSDFSFMSVSSSNSPEIKTGTLQDLFHAKMTTIKRTIAAILLQLEKEGSQDN